MQCFMEKEDKSLMDVQNVDIFNTTSARRLTFVVWLFRGHCTMLRCHHVMCSCFQYSGYDYVRLHLGPYLGLYKILKVH